MITGLSTGGAEMMLLKVLERLDKRFSPYVVSLTSMGEIGPKIRALGIPVHALGMLSGLPDPFAFFRLVRLLRSIGPQVVHTWMYHADLLGGLAARFAGVGSIGWCIRHSNVDRRNTKLSTQVVVAACAWLSRWVPDQILCCSEVARKLHVRYGYVDKKMVVIPNGFNLAQYTHHPLARASLRAELGLAADARLVGMVGRFNAQKNHDGFLHAAGVVHRRMPATHFVLVGNRIDQDNRELVAAVERAGTGQVTHLLGLRHDVPRLMAAFDLLVSASSFGEGFPNVVGEAMSCATPCVVTDVGDSALVVGDTGWVVPPSDDVALASKMEEALAMPLAGLQEMGVRARKRVTDNFEIGMVVKRYELFYDGLVAMKRGDLVSE